MKLLLKLLLAICVSTTTYAMANTVDNPPVSFNGFCAQTLQQTCPNCPEDCLSLPGCNGLVGEFCQVFTQEVNRGSACKQAIAHANEASGATAINALSQALCPVNLS